MQVLNAHLNLILLKSSFMKQAGFVFNGIFLCPAELQG